MSDTVEYRCPECGGVKRAPPGIGVECKAHSFSIPWRVQQNDLEPRLADLRGALAPKQVKFVQFQHVPGFEYESRGEQEWERSAMYALDTEGQLWLRDDDEWTKMEMPSE